MTPPTLSVPEASQPGYPQAPPPPMIALEHASKWYGQVIGVNDVSCWIPAGITALLGPNGAGKSTMFKLQADHRPASADDRPPYCSGP
jgi:ATPase subunit of ABC transporter with duplicated ATPase domains